MMAHKKQLFGQYRAFMAYRYQAYTTQLKQLLLQLKSFGLLFLIVLGSSVLGIVFTLLLGLGKIIDSIDAPQYGAQMAWLYLLLQSVMLTVVKAAIKNSSQRTFQLTLVKKSWLIVMDLKLLLLSHYLLVVSLVIAVNLNISQWVRAPHFIVFILLQCALGVLCLYKSKALTYGFILTAIWVVIPININPLIYQCGFLALFTLSLFITPLSFTPRLSVNSLLGFWLLYFAHYSWVLVWRSTFLICVFMASRVLLQERFDLAAIFSMVSLAFLVLLSSSLQFDCSELFKRYRLFFTMQNKQSVFFFSQFIPSLILQFITVIGFFTLFKSFDFLLLVFSLTWCLLQQYIAVKKPRYYGLVWMLITTMLLAYAAYY
ncbi:hypothetical protein J8L70_00075 [Pseudoalteromonas sp. MMG010]|uniref:DUF6136 family protein n=1 Tax=Pseudoalteromonas sp. MMG010 TaxID=2822685 RepID=UPI001B3A7B13|nr:DUF6136 family protein [Pseudoalteromonas sp. MMG010]MBQ4831639.1 hypothetical protein [Pseudoalteromonas sp. MMG010]